MALGALVTPVMQEVFAKKPHKKDGNNKNRAYETLFQNGDQIPFQSQWQSMPDMVWTGEEFWAQRLQDWEILNEELQCNFCGQDRTLNILTHQLSPGEGTFITSVDIKFPAINFPENKNNVSGFRLGLKGRFEDYRSAVITGIGIDAGISTEGFLYFGKQRSNRNIFPGQMQKGVRLECRSIIFRK